MPALSFKLKIGGLDAGSDPAKSGAQLLRLRITLTMDGAGGRCTLALAATDFTLPKPGDPVTVALDPGDGAADVFTGEVVTVAATADEVRIDASDGLSKLGRLEYEEVFEKQTAGKIARALLDAAGLQAGTVADGPSFPSYVLHRGPRALAHLQRLAEQCGVDLFTDGAGKVHFAGPQQRGEQHTFKAREHVLAVQLALATPTRDGVVVWGEGAASTKGEAKSHWLADDLASVSGKAGVGADGTAKKGSAGQRPHSVFDGAVRTGQVAGDLAAARALARASRSVRGHVDVLGAPAVVPGDIIQFESFSAGMPAIAAIAGTAGLRVRQVTHTLGAATGFVTRLEF